MAALIVIGFDNQVNARAAYDEAVALQTEFIIDLRGVAIVTVDTDGETHPVVRRSRRKADAARAGRPAADGGGELGRPRSHRGGRPRSHPRR